MNTSVDVERDRHTVIWQATIRVNPSLLLPLGIGKKGEYTHKAAIYTAINVIINRSGNT
jgi:hypothetical protein